MTTSIPSRFTRLAAAAVLAMCSAMATAGPALLSFSGGSSFIAVDGTNQTIGWSFTVAAGSGVTVTELGWFDQTPANPLDQNHQVGIWDLAGTLLGSVNVLTNSALSGRFRYEAITPLLLAGGASYLIGGAITAPFSDFYTVPATFAMDPMITFEGAARNGGSQGFSAPLTVTSGNGRFGPNFQFTANESNAVPEPGSALLVLVAGLGMVAASKRRGRAVGG